MAEEKEEEAEAEEEAEKDDGVVLGGRSTSTSLPPAVSRGRFRAARSATRVSSRPSPPSYPGFSLNPDPPRRSDRHRRRRREAGGGLPREARRAHQGRRRREPDPGAQTTAPPPPPSPGSSRGSRRHTDRRAIARRARGDVLRAGSRTSTASRRGCNAETLALGAQVLRVGRGRYPARRVGREAKVKGARDGSASIGDGVPARRRVLGAPARGPGRGSPGWSDACARARAPHALATLGGLIRSPREGRRSPPRRQPLDASQATPGLWM